MTLDTLETLLLGGALTAKSKALPDPSGRTAAQHRLSNALGRAMVEANKRRLLRALGVPIPEGVEKLEALALEHALREAAKLASEEEGENAGDDEGETGTFHTSTKPEGTSPSIADVKREQLGVTKKAAPQMVVSYPGPLVHKSTRLRRFE
jgi:hypothetical protein